MAHSIRSRERSEVGSITVRAPVPYTTIPTSSPEFIWSSRR